MAASISERVFSQALVKGSWGITWKEAADLLGLHHGQVSAALSRLHESGRLTRLNQKRWPHNAADGRRQTGASVYVVNEPRYVQGRALAPRRTNARLNPDLVDEAINEWLEGPSMNTRELADRIVTDPSLRFSA